MSTRHARRLEDEPVQVSEEKAPEQGPSTAEEYLQAVHALLDKTSSTWAQRAAAEGHAKFPDHPELERLCRLLTPRPARSVPRNGRKRDSRKIYRWLDENEIQYLGQWILVNEEGLVASAPTAEELLRKIEELGLDDDEKYNSLMHHVH